MSKITTIYDRFVTVLGTVYSSTHFQMQNPYNILSNDFRLLNRGYGFFVSAGYNTNRMLACEMSINRNVTFINSIVYRGTDRDITIRQTAEKTLLEDHILLVKTLEQDVDLNSTCAKLIYVSDSGISQLSDEHNNFLTINTIFEMEYFERL